MPLVTIQIQEYLTNTRLRTPQLLAQVTLLRHCLLKMVSVQYLSLLSYIVLRIR